MKHWTLLARLQQAHVIFQRKLPIIYLCLSLYADWIWNRVTMKKLVFCNTYICYGQLDFIVWWMYHAGGSWWIILEMHINYLFARKLSPRKKIESQKEMKWTGGCPKIIYSASSPCSNGHCSIQVATCHYYIILD